MEDIPCISTLYCSLYSPIHNLHSRLRLITIHSKNGFPASVHQLSLKHYSVVERIEFGPGSLQYIESLSLDDFNLLRILRIRSYAFSSTTSSLTTLSTTSAGKLVIWNCPCLKEVSIERNACFQWNNLSIINTPSLQSIRLGGWNFGGEMRLFQLDSLPSLKQLITGELCFTKLGCIQLSNLPQLELIGMGRGSFLGTGSSLLRIQSS